MYKRWGEVESDRKPRLEGHVCVSASPAQAPEGEAQAAVRVQAEGDLSGGVELTLQFYGATQGTGSSVGHLEETIQHTASP